MNFCPNCQQVFETAITACPADGTVLIPQLTEITSDPRLMIGRILENKYTITGVLGSGGMAFVMKARHIFLGRDVAIKILKPEILTIPELRKRFLREAKAASETKHPGIVDIMDFGITKDGIYYLVMEILEGENLFQYMKRNPCLQETEAARIAVGILDALGAVHARGIVHRDVKPDNFVLQSAKDGDLRIKLIDFGLAKFFDDSDPDKPTERLTRCSVVMGSPHHMSPEQARGLNLDARSDIYSVGCILYEMCTGRLPFEGRNSVEVMSKQLVEEPVSPRVHRDDLSEDFENLILGCLCKDPAHRFRSTGELTEAILALYPDAVGNSRTRNWTQEIAIPVKPADTVIDSVKDDAMDNGKPTMITGLPAAARHTKKLWLFGTGLAVLLALTAAAVLGVYFMLPDRAQQQPAKLESAQVPEQKIESPQPAAQINPDIVVKDRQDLGIVQAPGPASAPAPAPDPVLARPAKRPTLPKTKDKWQPKKQEIPKGFIDPFAGPGGK